jgi:hypothetical protein
MAAEEEAERGWGWAWSGESDASEERKSVEVVTESDLEAGEQRRDAIGSGLGFERGAGEDAHGAAAARRRQDKGD